MNARMKGIIVALALVVPASSSAGPKKPAPVTTNKPAPIKTPTTVLVKKPAAQPSLLFSKKLNNSRKGLKGFVDLHTHPMAHLSMGGKLLHGAPDVGVLMPAGAVWDSRGVGVSGATCNARPKRAASMAEALGSCYSSHAGHDAIKNKCGNHVRRMVINGFEDGKKTNKPHDTDHPNGFPAFDRWPKHNDVIHQQMWVDWIKRAHDGGLRVMVALTVNSVTLAKGLAGNEPYDDRTIGDLQIEEMKQMVARHKRKFGRNAWMDIAYSSADLRRIVAQDKLAIILGSEVDDIGNFALSKREPTAAQVRAEIRRLHSLGIRYMFPVHVIDNHFGGTALYEAEFPRASKYHFGHWPKMVCAIGDGISNRLDNGWDVVKTFALGEAGGSIPTPSNCPRGVGFKNSRGLTPLGKVAVEEMMSLGMFIDIDHASQGTVNAILDLAKSKRGGYPIVSGHNGLRGVGDHSRHENTRTAAQYQSIAASGGVAGIGFGELTAEKFVRAVNGALAASPGLAVQLGSDINGFVVMPKAENCGTNRCVQYDPATFPMASTNGKSWNYNVTGVAHIGLFPDFLRHVESVRGGKQVVDALFDGAEKVAQSWEKAERVRRFAKTSASETFSTIVATIRTTDDDVRGGARAWVSVKLRSGSTRWVEVSKLAVGANASHSVRIPVGRAIRASDVAGVVVKHESNDCFGCARDYWNGSVEIAGDGGQELMATPVFRIGHESKTFNR